MNFDPKARDTWFFVRNGGLMCRQPYPWAPDDFGQGDAIARSSIASIVLDGAREPMIRAMINCIHIGAKAKVTRYPGAPDTISRDQVGMLLVALWMDYQANKAWRFVFPILINNLPWRLSKSHWMTPDFRLWVKSLGGSRVLQAIWHLIMLIQFMFVVPWNRFFREITAELPESWRRVTDKIIYPTHALFIFAWQIYVTKKSWLRSLTMWVARQDAEKDNWVIRGLLGQKIPKGFKHVSQTGTSWAIRRSMAGRVPLRDMTSQEARANDIDGALLEWVRLQQ